jgi:hypothetical protein
MDQSMKRNNQTNEGTKSNRRQYTNKHGRVESGIEIRMFECDVVCSNS